MINTFEDLKVAVKEQLNIVEILGELTTIDYKGDGLCPFHNDSKKGSFKVDFKRNRYRCFACGAQGDALQLIQTQRNVDFVTAVYQLGYELGLISEDEMKNKRVNPENRSSSKINKTGVKVYKHTPKKNVVYQTTTRKELTEDEVNLYDFVYRVLGMYCGLDEADMEHLICDRMVGSDKLNDYFSLRNIKKKNVIENMVKLLNAKGITNDQIVTVPGFAYTKAGKVCLSSHIRGIAMKARNSEGKVIGIQVRTELEDKKYLWLSSSSKGGTSCSTPIAVEYPKMFVENGKLNLRRTIASTSDSILITEGKFKAVSLSNNFNSIAFGIAGIYNWKNKIKKDFFNITKEKNINNIVIFADADCAYNPRIFLQFKEMLSVELQGIKQDVYIAYWNIKHGKGIDDVIHSGNEDEVKYLKFDEYCSKFNQYLLEVNKYDLEKISENKEDKINIYNRIFDI